MKKILILLITSSLFVLHSLAATTFAVTANTSWSSLVGGTCSGCTFNISSGVTFTLNTAGTCANCTFNGGTILLTADFTVQQSAFNNNTITLDGQKLTLQGSGTDNSFSGVSATASGSGGIVQTAKTTMTSSAFTFSGLAQYFVNGGQLDISSSRFYLNENSSFYANSGPVNLTSTSNITAGDGTAASKAYLYLNGPQLTLVDANSTFSLANSNNYYFNWSTYKSTATGLSFNTATNAANCGTAGKNSCSAPKYYGCAMFSKTGPTNCTVLSAMIADFSGSVLSGNQVKLSWLLQSSDDGTVMVEHSTNAINFETISTRPATASAAYHFTDLNPAAGMNYYRIVFTGFDGVKATSGILSVRADASVTAAGVGIFPNPVSGGHFAVRTTTTQSVLLSIFSQDGRLLTGATLSGQTSYRVDVPKMANPGLLIVRIISGDQTFSFPLLNKP